MSENPNSYEVSGTVSLRFGFQFHLNVELLAVSMSGSESTY